jgi:hypothetical protein
MSPHRFHTHLLARLPFAKILLASVTLLHQPHLNLSTGTFFGNGSVEKEYHALPIDVHDRPLALPHATGGVIMSKLGNETAKWARFCSRSAKNTQHGTIELPWDVLRGNYCKQTHARISNIMLNQFLDIQ